MFRAKQHPILDVYAMLWHIVRAYPATLDGAGREIQCKRPQTFAALASFDDIDVDTLKKDARYADRDQHLFYSREWKEYGPYGNQISGLKFKYPLHAVQPFSNETKISTPFIHVRMSVTTMDQRPEKLTPTSGYEYQSHRTFEQLEADVTSIHESILLEWIKKWVLYEVGMELIWSPTKILGGKVKWKMKDAMLTDGVEGAFYRDVGIDRVSGMQGFINLKFPRLSCYKESERPDFVYPAEVHESRRPDGLKGMQQNETP